MAGKKKSVSKKQTNRPSKGGADLARAAAASTASNKKQTQGGQKKRTGILTYLRGVRQEFSKVVWPTREELVTDTIVVFATVIFFSLAFWLIDTGFLAALKGILGITLS